MVKIVLLLFTAITVTTESLDIMLRNKIIIQPGIMCKLYLNSDLMKAKTSANKM